MAQPEGTPPREHVASGVGGEGAGGTPAVGAARNPNRRDLIRMTGEEIDAFLHERNSMSVATIAHDGRPHVVAMWHGFFANGAPGFWTYAKSQKVRNLRRDPRLTCLVESGDTYGNLRGVELIATAIVHDDPEKVREMGRSMYERYFGPLDEAGLAAVERMMQKRVAVELALERVVSWDHGKLGGRY